MKTNTLQRSLSEKMMHIMRSQMRVPVTILMLACNLSWSLQSQGQVVDAEIDNRTRVIKLNTANAAADLRPGMTVSGVGIPPGTYITQILSGDQIMVNIPIEISSASTPLTFGAVQELPDTEAARTNWTKTTADTAVIFGRNSLAGTINIRAGTLQVGGVNSNARNWMQDLIADNAAIVMNNDTATVFEFARNIANTAANAYTPYALFERIGSLRTDGTTTNSLATVNLTNGPINTALAVGGDNSDSLFRGKIRGGASSFLIKEGTGNMTWQSDSVDSIEGRIRVDSGTLTITGLAGLHSGVSVSLNNLAGTRMVINTAGSQTISSLTGGGLGATGTFANGIAGALVGNYLSGERAEVNIVNPNSSGAGKPTFTLNNSDLNTVYAFAGNITGDGNLEKIGPNILELFGNNTYTGTTFVTAASVDNSNNILRIGAYGTSFGIGSLESGGYGSLPSTTRVQLSAGTSGQGRNVIFDLNGATQTLSSLISINDSGARSVLLKTGVLTINTGASDNSGTYDGAFQGYGTINVSATTGANGWSLTGDSNNSQQGFLNIAGGQVSLNRTGGTLGDRVHVNVNNAGILHVRVSDAIGSLNGNGTVQLDAGSVLTLTSGPSGGISNSAWAGNITGAGSFALAAGSSIRLTSMQNHLGSTILNSGASLYLDYGTGETHPEIIPGQLTLNGGNIYLRGSSGQTVNNVVLGTGATIIATELGSAAALQLTNISRNISAFPGASAGGSVLSIHGSSVSTSVANIHDILGGFATHHSLDANGNPVVSWATASSTGGVTGLSVYGQSFGPNINTDVNATNASSFTGGVVGSMRFANSAAVVLAAETNIQVQSGGILVSPTVGPSNQIIRGINQATITGGSDSSYRVANELIVHQHNTRGTLTLDIPVSNWNGDTRLTKTGQGTLVLTRFNTYTGQTSILGGVLELADSVTAEGVRGTLGDVAAIAPIQNFGYLSFNRSGGIYEVNNNIEGTGGVKQINDGEVVLRGTGSTYTGPTHVVKGTLSISSRLALGSTAGVTSISPTGTLQIRSSLDVPEIILLHGGTLEASGASGVSGTLNVTQDSTIYARGSDSSMLISGLVNLGANKTLTLNTEIGGGKVILTNPNNNIGKIVVGNNTTLQMGMQLTTDITGNTFSQGSIGRGVVQTMGSNSNIITGTQNSHLVLPTKITGPGSLFHVRNTIYLVEDNDYLGRTVVGGYGTPGLPVFGTELRVGTDTYTGSLGSGDIILNSGNGNATLRYHLAKSVTLDNNIFINPLLDNGTRNATFLRQGIGSITLAGTITAGAHGVGAQRSIIQTEGGAELTFAGRINSGEGNQVNIINNGFITFANPTSALNQEIWGILQGGGNYVFRNAGIMTLKSEAHISSAGGIYIRSGTLIIDYNGTASGGGTHDDNDFYVSRGARLEFNNTETIGSLQPMHKSEVQLNNGATVTIDDNIVYGSHGTIKGDGTLIFAANGGTGWYGLFGDNELLSDAFIGSGSQQTTVRVNKIGNSGEVGNLGKGSAINLGVTGASVETRFEYTGLGETTNRDFNLGSGASTIRIAGSGKAPLVIAGNVNVTSAGNKTLMLHGQTIGNKITGIIDQGGSILSLQVNPNAGNNDMYGHGRWILTNENNNFSGNITVNLGVLELAGNLGDGSGNSSVLGDLTANRTISLGTNNFDGRKFDVFSGGDNYGASSNALISTGSLLFNDIGTGTATFGANIKFIQDFNNTSNPGSGEIINNGNKVLVFQGTFSAGASGNRNWILDGTNSGENTISGVISDTSTTGANTVGILKEGTGLWRLSGNNTYEGVTQIARGILEITGGSTIFDNGVLNLTNAGSDFSAVGGATLRILQSETVGGLAGSIGSTVEIASGQALTVRADTQVFNGVITGEGSIVRSNNNTSSRDMTLTNLNTYTGSTTITVTGSNTGVPRINAFFLADGGQASSIGASSNAASNLVLDAGIASGGLRWQGATNQSTDRLFTIGTGTNGIWADGRNWGDQPKALSFTNTGAIAFVASNTTQTLALRGGTIAENIFAPQLTNNGSAATNLIKTDAGMWVLTNANTYSGGTSINAGTLAISNSSALGTGGVAINGGAGTGLQLRGGLTVSNTLTNNTSEGGLAAFSGNNVWSGNITLAGSNANFRLGVNEGASLNITGAITGALGTARFIKYDGGTLSLSGTNTYTGITAFAGGTVILNYDTAAGGTASNKLADASRLELGFLEGGSGITSGLGGDPSVAGQSYQRGFGGATLILSGGQYTEVINGILINNGANKIIRNGAGSILQMGAITRNVANGINNYGTLDFSAAAIATTSTTNTAGILGSTAFATVGKLHWATAGSTLAGASGNSVNAFTAYANNTFNTADNTNITNALVTASSGATINTLRFDNNITDTTLTLSGVLNVTAGGILVPENVTKNITITGTSGSLRRTATTANLDMVVHHFGSGLLNINVPLVNNSGALAFTKTGKGTVVLNATNTFTGRVSIQQGILQVGDGTSDSTSARLGSNITANPISMSDGATLKINVANANMEYIAGALSGEGLLHLAPDNQSVFILGSDNVNWVGETLIQGGTLRVQSNSNALGNLRGMTTVDEGGTLDFRILTVDRNFSGRITMKDGSLITVTNNGTPNNLNTVSSGTITFDTTSSAGAKIDVSAGQQMTFSGMFRTAHGFTKQGAGVMTLSANQMQEFQVGAPSGVDTPTANPALMGQIIVAQGELRVGNPRALGGTGVGNETIVVSGASLDLRGQALNWGDDPTEFREVIQIRGAGVNGVGALKNSTGNGFASAIVFNGDATLGGGGYAAGSRLMIAGYDIEAKNSSVTAGTTVTGNYQTVQATIDGRGANLTIVGNATSNDSVGTGVTLRDINFISALNSITVSEGVLRIDREAGSTSAVLSSANITNGITVAYGGATLGDHTNAALGVGPNVGARLNFYRNWETNHSVNITLDGVKAKANLGANYIDNGNDTTIPNPRTYLSGTITLTGDADRNFFHIDGSAIQQTIAEQGNLTGTIQSKLIITGQIVGSGGFTKTGLRELRLVNNNTFTGAVNVLRSATAAVRWQDNLTNVNGIDYQTYGDGESWAEWGLTLSGLNGRLSGTSDVNLQRRGLITLDNTTRLDQTNSVAGGYQGDRIFDGANINFSHGWIKINGGADNTQIQTESLATSGGAKMNLISGSNMIDLMPTDGASTRMVLTIGEINRSPGSVLHISALDSTTRFDSSDAAESVRVILDRVGNLQQVGAGTSPGSTNKSVVVGLFGGIMPHEYMKDIRELGYNNGNADYLNQGRNQQFIASSHFMTYDVGTRTLRPLDDSEYFVPTDGLLDRLNGSAGQNVNLLEAVTVMRQNMSVNTLRFGPLADNNGSGGAVNDGTRLTSYVDAHNLQLWLDGTMTINSGMLSSAYFAVGNASVSTVIAGGTLNFGNREAIINNQNALVRNSDGALATGNLEIRSTIAGRAGLLKTGIAQVVLDGRNTYTGTTTISNGTLYLRSGRSALGASGAGNGVMIEGNGSLNSGAGIRVGSPTAFEDVFVGALQNNVYVMRANDDLTNWYSNLIVDNVDASGSILHTILVRADASATSLFQGNIYGGPSAVSHDVVAMDSRIIQFEANSNNNFIFRGQFGDKADANGKAVPIADPISTLPSVSGVRTNENEVLRINLNSPSETNFVMEQQYNAAGRLYLSQGNLIITYDPNSPNGDGSGFWTNAAISKIPNGLSGGNFSLNGNSSHMGFILGNGSSGSAALFLSRPGQVFNMGSWTSNGSGLKWVGGLNETGTVKYGTTSTTNNILTVSNSVLRLYSMAGGKVEMDYRFINNIGTAPDSIGFIKVGRGTVVLQNTTNGSATNSNAELAGGKLVLDYDGRNIDRLGTAHAILSGGVLHALSNSTASSTANIANAITTSSVTISTDSTLQVRMGNTEIIAEGRNGQSMTVNIGNAALVSNRATLTRALGGTLNFVESTSGTISLNFNSLVTAVAKNRTISWATYGTVPGQALDFAMSDNAAANRVKMVTRDASHYQNNVMNWAANMDVSENGGSGFFGTLAANLTVNTVRFDALADSTFTIGAGQTLSLAGNGIAGALLVSSNTGTANKTINGGAISTATSEIILHQYGRGSLILNSDISGGKSLVIAGPSTTSPESFGTTGTVRLNGAKTYTGATYITGAVLEISNVLSLGPNPTSLTNGHLNLNGGTLRWAGGVGSLGNRGVFLNGDGGVIEVSNPNGNLVIGNSLNIASGASGGLASQEMFRGDLVKTGAGTITFLGNNAAFQGLLDVRQGSIVVMADIGNANAGTTTVFGTNRSMADGTIMRNGTDMQVFLGAANNAGDWGIEEYITFEGNNTFTYGGLFENNVNLALDLSSNLYNLGNRRPLNMNGVMDIQGTTTFSVTNNGILRLNNGSGYIKGAGDIVKDDLGRLEFRSNIPDWTGNLIIKQGSVYVINQADVLGTGYTSGKTITLGSSDRQGVAELLIHNADSFHGWEYDINHDINVVYNPAQTKRLGIDNITNSNLVSYNGNITLNDNLILLMRDVNIAAGGEQSYVNYNGSFRDGLTTSGNLVIQTDDNDATPSANSTTSGRQYGYAIFNGDNSGWTGDITIGINTVYNQDTSAILRLGNTKALTAANDVTMNYNSILQAGGQNVTVGNLITQGGNGAFYGTAGTISSNLGSSEIIENAAATPANLTITQSTPATHEASWDAFFRDGTLNSQFFAPGANILQPSAALSITKAGNGWATLTLDNDYSGATIVKAGILQVGRGGVGDTGATPSVSNAATLMTRVLNGGTLAGTGAIQGKLTIESGGILRTGDSAGAEIGTLSVAGDAIFASGSSAFMQVRAATYNNPGALVATDEQYAFWRNGVLTDAFAAGLNDIATNVQHDMLVASGSVNWVPGTKIVLQNDGYTPKAGDIIRLFKGTTLNGNINVGPYMRSGGEADTTGLDLILFALSGNLVWDVSLFNSTGILMVIEAERDVVSNAIPRPVITQEPTANINLENDLDPGTMVTLSADARTTAPGKPENLRFQWFLNDIPVAGATSKTYTFAANYNTKGAYRFSATNEGGTTLTSTETAVIVKVNDIPDITFDNSTVIVNPGEDHTFDVAVGGQEPFTYQWYKDGEIIEEATNKTLVLTSVSEDDEGYYSVEVTNVSGTRTSLAALLNVRDPITALVLATVPAVTYLGQDIQLVATFEGEGVMTFVWKRNGAVISNAPNGPIYMINKAKLTDEAVYTVEVTSPVGTVVSNPVNLTLQKAEPEIINRPMSKTILAGQPLDLKVNAIGRPDLRFVWKKNNKVLPGATSADISKESALVSDGGTYTVEVSNTADKVNTVLNPAEIVVVDNGSRYLPVQAEGTASFPAVVGVGPKTEVIYQWFRVELHEVEAPIGGGNNGGDEGGESDDEIEEEPTPPDEEEPNPPDEIVLEERLVVIDPNPRISGINSKLMKITKVVPADEGLYRLVVTGPDGVSVAGSDYDLRIFSEAPAFSVASLEFDDGLIGRNYSFMTPINRVDKAKTPEKITAKGLPPGLKIDSLSGLITGVPTTSKVGGYNVTITLANKFGKISKSGTIIINDLSGSILGTWVGLVNRHPTLGSGMGGRMDLAVTAKATFSGKILLGGASYSFKGPLNMNGESPTGTVVIKRPGKPAPPALRLTFALNPTNNTISSGTVSDGTSTTTFSGWRNIYSKAAPATDYTGYYTTALGLDADSPLIVAEGTPNVPLGSGYATFTVATDGKLRMIGRLPDGEAISQSIFVGPTGQLGIYQYLYKSLKPVGGSILGRLNITAVEDTDSTLPPNSNNTIGGSLTWARSTSAKLTDRTFKAGFGVPTAPISQPLEIVALGGRYNPPPAGKVVLGLPEVDKPTENSVEVEFYYGGDLNREYVAPAFPTKTYRTMDPDWDFAIGKGSRISVLKENQKANVTRTTVRANPKTGLITGSFTGLDLNPRFPMRPHYVRRTVKFQGVLIQETVSGNDKEWVGVGYFLLPQMPSVEAQTTEKTSPIFSGRFDFKPIEE